MLCSARLSATTATTMANHATATGQPDNSMVPTAAAAMPPLAVGNHHESMVERAWARACAFFLVRARAGPERVTDAGMDPTGEALRQV